MNGKNQNKHFISIIIPTYKRPIYLKKILTFLIFNYLNFKFFEVIICDSDKSLRNKLIINKFKKKKLFKISYFNLDRNNHSQKRNLGIKKAKSNFIIFLDDDCFPEKTFVKDYFRILKKNKSKSIFCGSVLYPKNKNNFIKYRQNRHFIVKNSPPFFREKIEIKNIVTMNMAFNLNNINYKKLFNERFNRYGFEDHDFAYWQNKSGVSILKSGPKIIHYDLRSYEKYLQKIVFVGKEGMKYFLKLNFDAAKDTNYYKLETNNYIKFLLKYKLSLGILETICNLMISFEKKLFYFPLFIKLGIISAYLIGFMLRNNKNLNSSFENNSWYV